MLSTKSRQGSLFAQAPALPDGLVYQPDVLAPADEAALLQAFATLPFRAFEFHGYVGKRRVLSFGWRYDFNGGDFSKTDEIPAFLLPARAKTAALAGLPESALEHVLLTDYPAGAAIGWHKDRSVFGDVIGLSLASPCVFRLRRRVGNTFERAAFTAEPRAAYLLRGAARHDWEHSIPAVDDQRYSITFRTLA